MISFKHVSLGHARRLLESRAPKGFDDITMDHHMKAHMQASSEVEQRRTEEVRAVLGPAFPVTLGELEKPARKPAAMTVMKRKK